MDPEIKNEFRHVWDRMKQFEEDSRTLLVLNSTMKRLGKQVNRMTLAATGIMTAVVADLITHWIHK